MITVNKQQALFISSYDSVVAGAMKGATTLQGKSDQKFKSNDHELHLDETNKMTIYARLVGTDELHPKSNSETATTLRSLQHHHLSEY